MSEITEPYIIGHLSWQARFRLSAGIAVSLVLFTSIGIKVLKPWDPLGAISLLLVDNKIFLMIKVAGLLIASSIFSTIIMKARLPLFGLFSACVGISYPIMKTAGMDYLMVRLQVGKEFENSQILWAYLIFETFLWSIVLLSVLIITIFVENWLAEDVEGNDKSSENIPRYRIKIKYLLKRNNVINGIISMILTAGLGTIFIAILATSQSKGQVIFATFAGMLLASMISEQIMPTDHPIWQSLAVPIVAYIAYSYTWFHPDRPPGLEAVLHIAPNNLAKVLPIEYIFIGCAGAICGMWYSFRFRHSEYFDTE